MTGADGKDSRINKTNKQISYISTVCQQQLCVASQRFLEPPGETLSTCITSSPQEPVKRHHE